MLGSAALTLLLAAPWGGRQPGTGRARPLKKIKNKNPNIRMTRKRTAGQRAGSAGKEQATGSRYGESE